MEPTESGLSSYYHHHHNHHPQTHPPPPPPPQQSPTAAATSNTTATVVTASPTNGTLPPHMAYTHSASSTVTPASEAAKRKRGRPRKYSTPEEAAAARKALLASAPKKKKKDRSIEGGVSSSFSSSYSKKTNLASLAVDNGGQGFAAHILTVDWGQDVYQTIMSFMQKNKCEICILSASGSISNPSLRQPATFGGNITYEGNFHILSLSGSYIHTELGGRSGGLSVCLSNTDGHIIGGGIGGPLKAAGPVQVIVGAFQIDTRKDMHVGMKGDATFLNFQSPVGGTSVS